NVGLHLQISYEKFLTKKSCVGREYFAYPRNETALCRLHRRTSKTLCHANLQSAGFKRRAAWRCRAPCDPAKNLFPGPGDEQTNWRATTCWLSLSYHHRDSALRLQPGRCAVAAGPNDRDYVSGRCRSNV